VTQADCWKREILESAIEQLQLARAHAATASALVAALGGTEGALGGTGPRNLLPMIEDQTEDLVSMLKALCPEAP
jgi:hypothetical protein